MDLNWWLWKEALFKWGVRRKTTVAKLSEYSNHADSSTEYKWCNTAFSAGESSQPCSVGSFLTNSWGLNDMHGNVWEWVEDCWHQEYSDAPSDGSAWTSEDCTDRVVRSGSFNGDINMVSSSFRMATRADYPSHLYGFRVARTRNLSEEADNP